VGGVYGVAAGGLFAGESMFHTETDASKVALVALVARLRERGFVLFDVQMATDHTRTLGAVEIPRHEYLLRLREAVGTTAAICAGFGCTMSSGSFTATMPGPT
jgi:leucyl/phenylalanyl-tRNA--protein transferase